MTSTRLRSLPGAYVAAWDGAPEPLSIWQVPILPAARVYEIQGPPEWAALTRRYKAETAGGDDKPVIDWWLVADDFDGVHLSMSGYLTVPDCAHWLHESTVWVRPEFGEIVRLPDWPHDEAYTNFDWPAPEWPAPTDEVSDRSPGRRG